MGLCSVLALVVAGPIVAERVPFTAPHPWQDPVRVVSERSMTAALEELTPPLMSLPGVVGVGEGRCDGKPCIKVLVVEKTEDLAARIHDVVRGETVEIVETGEIRARQKDY